MRFYVYPYQHKSEPYRRALVDAGHIEDTANPDVIFVDRDWYMHNHNQPRPEVLRHPGAAVMVYPHSALPPWWYDGLIKIQPYVRCIFVIGEGQRRAMNVIAPFARVETTGWAWSELVPFEPRTIRRILFAPIHPAGGQLRPEAKRANAEIIEDLTRLSGRYEIVVRYVGNRFRQGLRRNPRFEMVQGATDGSTADIDNADLVIAEGTMMYLAVARGKPVIGINQHVPVRANKHSDIYTPQKWDLYGPHIGYPINYGDAPLSELIQRAASEEQKQWRQDFIGDAMNPCEFAAKVERLMNGRD